MCLIVFSYQAHPRYPFILAANRDEFYNRPAIPLHRWDTDPEMIAGKDEKAGGTWLGVTPQGRIAFLTNYRKMSEIKQNAPSRGHIVTDFLQSNSKPINFLRKIQHEADAYNGFNLFAGYFDDLFYFSNKLNENHSVEPGIHGISNALLNTSWPKTDRAKSRFEKILLDDEPDEDQIFDLLSDDERFPPEKLPDTGLSAEMEQAVSSIFIRTSDYGTRCSTLVMIDRDHQAKIVEKTYDPSTAGVSNTVRIELDLNVNR